jgi:hypothetical protein
MIGNENEYQEAVRQLQEEDGRIAEHRGALSGGAETGVGSALFLSRTNR